MANARNSSSSIVFTSLFLLVMGLGGAGGAVLDVVHAVRDVPGTVVVDGCTVKSRPSHAPTTYLCGGIFTADSGAFERIVYFEDNVSHDEGERVRTTVAGSSGSHEGHVFQPIEDVVVIILGAGAIGFLIVNIRSEIRQRREDQVGRRAPAGRAEVDIVDGVEPDLIYAWRFNVGSCAMAVFVAMLGGSFACLAATLWWLFLTDPTVRLDLGPLAVVAVTSVYLVWCLWRIGRVVVDVCVPVGHVVARIRSMERHRDRYEEWWEIGTDCRRRRFYVFHLTFRPPLVRTEPLAEGTIVRIAYQKGTARVIRMWAYPSGAVAEAGMRMKPHSGACQDF
jgi:hypothetical protein